MNSHEILQRLQVWLVYAWSVTVNLQAWDWFSVLIRLLFTMSVLLILLWIVPFTRKLGNKIAYAFGYKGVLFVFYFFMKLLRAHLVVIHHLIKPRDQIYKCLRLDLMRQEEDKFKKSKKVYF